MFWCVHSRINPLGFKNNPLLLQNIENIRIEAESRTYRFVQNLYDMCFFTSTLSPPPPTPPKKRQKICLLNCITHENGSGVQPTSIATWLTTARAQLGFRNMNWAQHSSYSHIPCIPSLVAEHPLIQGLFCHQELCCEKLHSIRSFQTLREFAKQLDVNSRCSLASKLNQFRFEGC